jgi:hypothetical protein
VADKLAAFSHSIFSGNEAGCFLWSGATLALASAALLGASTPLAKLPLGLGRDPWQLAGLLYLGPGVGLSLMTLARRLLGGASSDAPLRR